jgi:outer membrane cobalamin receptor
VIGRVVCAAVLLGVPATLLGQAPASVRGRVVDGSSGVPIAAARIEVGGASSATGGDGRFTLSGMGSGLATLVVTAIGYRAARIVIDLVPGIETEQSVRLVPKTLTLPDLTVEAEPDGVPVLDHDALVQRGPDLASALDGWQGIVVRRSGGNGPASPQVRGSAPEEVIVLLDGFTLNDPLTGRADLTRVASRDVGSVRVMAGPQSAGGAGTSIGGVISITSRSPGPGAELSSWAGSYGSMGATLAGSMSGIRLFARGAALADGYPYDVPANRGGGEALRQNAGGYVGELSIRRSGAVSVQARASASRRGLPGPLGNETATAEADDRVGFLGITVDRAYTLSASLQYLRTDARDPTPPSVAPYDVTSEGVSGTLDWSAARPLSVAGWGGSLNVGASARHDRYGGDAVGNDARFTRGGVRGSATLRPSADGPWTLTPAFRLDLWTGASHPFASARLDAGWQRGGTSLHASAGSAVAAPPLADLFFREGVGVALNPGLRPERVRWELEMGIDQEWQALGRPASATLRAYTGQVDDMILWSPGVGFIWSPRNYDVVRRGIEGSATVHPLATITLEAHGAYSPVTYDVPGGAQVQYRPIGTWEASAGWGSGPWALSSRWRWVSQRYPNPGGVNPRPAFGVLDVGAQRTVGPALVRADVHDLLDTRAEFLAGYPTPGRTAVLSISLEWQ